MPRTPWHDTPARAEARETNGFRDTCVPKAMRKLALELASAITDAERRTAAMAFVLHKCRKQIEITRFIERMEAAQ